MLTYKYSPRRGEGTSGVIRVRSRVWESEIWVGRERGGVFSVISTLNPSDQVGQRAAILRNRPGPHGS